MVELGFVENSGRSSRPRAALLVTDNETLLVNGELPCSKRLCETYIARTRRLCVKRFSLVSLNKKEAQDNKIGIYMDCDLQQQDDMIACDDQFEPMEYTFTDTVGR